MPMESPAGARRRLRLMVLVGFTAALLATAATSAQDPSPRLRVARRKALFIEQFTRLVDWPSSKLPRDSPFVVCVQGTSDTADELARIAAFRKFKERPCQLRRVRPGPELAACHVVYLAANEAPRLAQSLAAVADKPILTVSDTPGFVERGVQFNLFDEMRSAPPQGSGTYVGYELNGPAVRRSVLVFDPRLLSAGRRIEP
jgi:hypothetical protein